MGSSLKLSARRVAPILVLQALLRFARVTSVPLKPERSEKGRPATGHGLDILNLTVARPAIRPYSNSRKLLGPS